MKVSFITTVFNEEDTIDEFLDSLLHQTRLPDEIIIADGGSKDTTLNKIKEVRLKSKDFKKFVFLSKKGNRSVGRNEAIKHANSEIIVCSDSGNTLDKNWVKNIIEPFRNNEVDVVAGYYQGVANNVFQKSVIPYALIMPDKVDPLHFLPATRSVAFTKKIWKRVGGFDEKLSHNEDYAFAKELEKAQAKIVFKKNAIVYWKPRNSIREAFIMMYRFAYGDAQARIFRPKVLLVFLRYFIASLILILAVIMQSYLVLNTLFILLILYLIWSIFKNYRYVNEWQAVFILPLLQILADWAVLKGTTLGLFGSEIRYN